MNNIKGLNYLPNAISEEKEKELLEFINNQPYDNTLKRQTQQYGYKYNYINTQTVNKTQPIPDILLKLIDDLKLENINQIIINKYEPGEGISAHIDSKIFGDKVIGLSLQSGIIMEFTPLNNYLKTEPTNLYLEPRSLFTMESDARYNYTHCIKNKKIDIINGKKIKRGIRISITFRTFIN